MTMFFLSVIYNIFSGQDLPYGDSRAGLPHSAHADCPEYAREACQGVNI